MHTLLIKANGETFYPHPFNSRQFELKEIEVMIEGEPEIHYFPNKNKRVMIINRDAKKKNLKLNIMATSLFHIIENDFICGSVLLVDEQLLDESLKLIVDNSQKVADT